MAEKIINGIPIAGWRKSNWLWSMPLYLACGVPYATVFLTALVFFNRMGLSNSAISFISAACLLPVILRPLLERLVVWYGTKRTWILLTELAITLSIEAIALLSYTRLWLPLAILLLIVITAAAELHSVAVKHFYKLSTARKQRRATTVPRIISSLAAIATVFALPVMMAGNLEVINRAVQPSWAMALHLSAAIMLALLAFHFARLPRPVDTPSRSAWHSLQFRFQRSIGSMTQQKILLLAALFVFILPESMFSRVAPLFLIDPGSNGGLSLSPQEIALVIGSVGFFALATGIIVGNRNIARKGLRASIRPMTLALTLPKAAYIYLSYSFTSSLWLINLSMFVELFSLGFGMVVYARLLLTAAGRPRSVLSYSTSISLLSLSMFFGSIIAGILEEYLGYRQFFIIATLLGLPVIAASHIFLKNIAAPHILLKNTRR